MSEPKGHAQKRAAAAAAPDQSCGVLLEGTRLTFERWVRGMMELSQEVMQFTQARFQEDAAAWTQLAGLRQVDEILQFQQRFAERTVEEYMEEFNRVSQIIAGMANGKAAPPRGPERQPDAARDAAA